MPSLMIVGIVVGLVVVSLLISGACYALMARLLRAPAPTFRRGLIVAIVSLICSTAVLIGFQLSDTSIEANLGAVLLASFVGNIVIPIFAAGYAFRTTLLRSTGIVLGAMVLAGCGNLLLALGVKSTLIEAFTIPTGSMAPTIRGAHVERPCYYCGRAMVVSAVDDGLPGRQRDIRVRCNNCGHSNAFLRNDNDPLGDRVAVDKLTEIDRWDLVVFRRPGEPQSKYIKRFVGMPGEKIEWFEGELFADGKLLRKPPGRMDSLWIPVNDSSFVAERARHRGWVADANEVDWQLDEKRWTANAAKGTTAFLQFEGQIDSYFEYNGESRRNDSYRVRDIMVRLTQASLPRGVFTVDYVSERHTIQFEIDSETELLKIVQAKPFEQELASVRFAATSLELEPIEFAIRDGQAYVRRGRETIASGEFGPSELAEFRKFGETDAVKGCFVLLSLRGGSMEIGRIELLRDVYYVSTEEIAPGGGMDIFIQPKQPISLGDDEYLALGDNSAAALDSRFWGPVPRENIIGVARWRYAPIRRAQSLE
jgi:signal peptidase I